MSFGKGQPTKLVAKFSWAKVDTDLVRKMLVEYSNTCGVNAPSTLDDNRLKVSPPETLTRLAEVYLGSPPRSDVFDSSMTDLLREEWLPRASARVVAEVYHYVNLADPDGTYHRTKQERVHFLATRRKTVTFINRLRTLFINQHKDRTPTRSGTRRSGDAIAPTALVGSGAKPPKALHGYQLEAQRNLDALIRAAQPSDRRGVLVFPTGAGKTATVVSWALQKMVEQPELRILWVAHQQELLSQAVRVFREWAPTCPPEFVRTAREIHAFGSAKETLASAETDIAAITIHSLASNLDRHKQQRITTFLSRPTIVFIDEAHRAAAPTYQDLLTLLGESPSVLGIVGLTATPWPSAANAKTLFNRSFPTVVHRVEQEELIASGVLAQPVLHSIDTNLLMPLTAEEITATTNGGEIPPSVLKRLNVEQRNRCIRKVWDSSPEQWGKTLVFATSIEHAEELGEIFADVEHRVLHSQSLDSPQSALAWFRTTKGPAVLISVGMLTEGVDLPQARTAFLARPTASRILLRQMIGRVLRGPAANGDAFANLVNFRDVWTNFGEILDPSDVIRHLGRSSGDGSDRPPRGNARAEDGGEVPSDVEAEIQRQLEAFRAKINEAIEREPSVASIDPLITCVRLVGYYQLPDRVIPVFDHQLHAFAELLSTTLAGKKKGQAYLSSFDDTPPPYPSRRTVKELVDFARQQGFPPPLIDMRADIGPRLAAQHVLDAGAIDEATRSGLIRENFETTLARAAYRSLEHFEEAVEQELRRRRAATSKPGFEEGPLGPASPGLPKMRRAERDLPDLLREVRSRAVSLVGHHAARLTEDAPLTIEWTRQATKTFLGTWTLRTYGKAEGSRTIRINELLRTTRQIVSDEMLQYLIYHELLHDLLPGLGHNSEFRELEARWPNSAQLDADFMTLHERWNTDPASYRKG